MGLVEMFRYPKLKMVWGKRLDQNKALQRAKVFESRKPGARYNYLIVSLCPHWAFYFFSFSENTEKSIDLSTPSRARRAHTHPHRPPQRSTQQTAQHTQRHAVQQTQRDTQHTHNKRARATARRRVENKYKQQRTVHAILTVNCPSKL